MTNNHMLQTHKTHWVLRVKGTCHERHVCVYEVVRFALIDALTPKVPSCQGSPVCAPAFNIVPTKVSIAGVDAIVNEQGQQYHQLSSFWLAAYLSKDAQTFCKHLRTSSKPAAYLPKDAAMVWPEALQERLVTTGVL